MKKYSIIFVLFASLVASAISPNLVSAAVPSDEGEPCLADRTTTPITIYTCVGGTVCNRAKNQCEKPQAAAPLTANKIYLSYGPTADACDSAGGTIMCDLPRNLLAAGPNAGIPQAFGVMAQLYDQKPASTYLAFNDFKTHMGFPVKEAYAQGYGFVVLNPIIGLWRMIRNLALAGFVVIFVVIGLMIMLRKNIDPRTVVTIQQAIPRIVISLVLVIFSYAICGLLIDSIMVATRAGLLVFQSAGYVAQGGTAGNKPGNADDLLKANIFVLFSDLSAVDQIVPKIQAFVSTGVGQAGFGVIEKFVGALSSGGGILTTVLWVAIFISILRTAFMLITAYVTIVFNIIFSPFRFLMMAIPGSQSNFTSWLKAMYRQLLVFPVVFFMLMFAAIFGSSAGGATWNLNPGQDGENIWNIGGPPEAPNGVFDPANPNAFWAPPGLGNWGAALGQLMMLGIILTIPKAANMVTEALQIKPGSSEGAAGEEIKRAAGRIPVVGSLVGR
ncbi:MAG: hypothetical protein M3Q44_01150 [bacterium]|nr:hypothetical protein [bacterium]